MQNANQVQTGTKKMKVNPSQSLIGKVLTSQDAIKVNFRRGKTNVITCNQIECTGVNEAGRRLTLVFKDAQGTELMTRRVYKEHFERMADKFGVDLF
jgi:hypothetical protein